MLAIDLRKTNFKLGVFVLFVSAFLKTSKGSCSLGYLGLLTFYCLI